jgi:hypothetical protein
VLSVSDVSPHIREFGSCPLQVGDELIKVQHHPPNPFLPFNPSLPDFFPWEGLLSFRVLAYGGSQFFCVAVLICVLRLVTRVEERDVAT